MTPNDSTLAYRRAAIENAPPLKLVQMLYQGGLRFLGEGRAALEAGDLPRFTERVAKAQAIVAELRTSLDADAAEGLCEQLSALYGYMQVELTEAIIDKDLNHLAGVEGVLRTLLEAWRALDFQEGPV
ncbi:MAG: flagellar export chaperone FliS [Planctomycetota bacterium]|nr:flagellar export chaperone FliS [Planctomycetota bacterium]